MIKYTKEETQMILNHKKHWIIFLAIEIILKN